MSAQLPKPKCCNLKVSWIFLVQVFCFSLQQILFCRCKDPLSVLWLHAATRVPNRNWDTPILICVIMKPGEITDRENRVKGKAGRCALNICRIWMIVMRQNRQSEEVLLNCDKYFSQFYGHYGWIINSGRVYSTICDDPGFCCFVISCFILKSCPHLSCFSPSLCVISLLPVFYVPSLTCSLLPPPRPLVSVYKVFVLSPCLRQIVPVFLVCLLQCYSRGSPVLTSWYALVLCSLCFHWFLLCFCLQLFCCYFVFFLSLWLIVFPGFLFFLYHSACARPQFPHFIDETHNASTVLLLLQVTF